MSGVFILRSAWPVHGSTTQVEIGDDGGEVKSWSAKSGPVTPTKAQRYAGLLGGSSGSGCGGGFLRSSSPTNPLVPERPMPSPSGGAPGTSAQAFAHGQTLGAMSARDQPPPPPPVARAYPHGRSLTSASICLAHREHDPEQAGGGEGSKRGGSAPRGSYGAAHGQRFGASSLTARPESGSVAAPPLPKPRAPTFAHCHAFLAPSRPKPRTMAAAGDGNGGGNAALEASKLVGNVARLDPKALLALAISSKKQRLGMSSVRLGDGGSSSGYGQQRSTSASDVTRGAAKPVQRQYPHGRSLGFESGWGGGGGAATHSSFGPRGSPTKGEEPPRPQQRRYPHGRSLGFESSQGTSLSPNASPAASPTTSPLFSRSGGGGSGSSVRDEAEPVVAGKWSSPPAGAAKQRQAMGCRSLSASDVAPRPAQRVYPHGRHIGFSTIKLG